ncbi:ABC transporter permease [Paenirhodobacter hankyongi]|uniref:ABC transporter permease n=1 Tax=Paenirhodobacter hankyongi TaxID=2294033 RepID=A0A421BJU3_9RHOB|nr:ABC transporter permease [Sinirhodobacter hankyongi]RLL62465.1 ABC transporter permease [Sinirhodobacter hankyongi]
MRRLANGAGFLCAMSLPGALVTFGLVAFALALVLGLGFRVNDQGLLRGPLTLGNFAQILADPLYAKVMLRSLWISGLVTLATVVTAYPVAWYLAFRAGRHRGLLLFLVTLPFWTSYLLRVFAWKIVLAYNGVLNSAMIELGLWDKPSMMFLNNPAAVVLTLAHAYAPFAILPIYVALQTIPRSLLEAGADLGATKAQLFRRVVLPISMPGVLGGALVVFVPTLGDYVTPAMVGGPASTMIGTLIQAQFGKANDWPFGAALATATMLVILIAVALVRQADRRWGSRT